MERRLHPVILVASLLLAACILPSERRYAAHEEEKPPLAEDSASHTLTQAIVIDNEKMGYLLTYLEVPIEVRRPQVAPTNSSFIKDLDFQNIGYITPTGQTFRYVDGVRSEEVCRFETRKNLAVFFGRPMATVELQDI